MAKKTKPRLHQNRPVRYLQLLIAAALTVDYLTFDTISRTSNDWFLLIPFTLVAIAVLAPVKKSIFRNLKIQLLYVYYSFAAVLLIFLADVFGPYFQLLVLLVLTSVIWLGTSGMVYGLLASYAIVTLAVLHQSQFLSQAHIYQTLLYVSSLTILGFIFDRVILQHLKEKKLTREVKARYFFERTRMLSLINSMPDAVIATDANGVVLHYNGAAMELFDTNEDFKDEPIDRVVEFKDANNQNVDIIKEARIKNAQSTRNDIYFNARDGSQIYIDLSVSPIIAAGKIKEVTGFILVMRDITKQKTLDEQRDEFVSVAAHELRTPVAIAEANISTALLPKFTKRLSKEGRKLLEQAHDDIVFLSVLVNDLYVLAQTEQGELGLGRDEVKPVEFLQKVADSYRRQAQEKDLSLYVITEEEIEPVITSADALKEVMQNLVINAIKYTEEGGISLSVHKDKVGRELIFTVTDTGIGISASDQKHIFEKFYRSEDYRTRKNGGTGLGLYIVKRLAERVNGRVWFESRLNKGSTFYFALPVRTAKGRPVKKKPV